jgi:hypothetical protein
MKLADVEEAKSYYSGKTSDVTRQLTLAGIAVVWILRDGNASPPVPSALIPVLAAYVLTLALDILHYTLSTLTWTRCYYKLIGQGISEDEKFDTPKRINWPGYILFRWKIAAFLFGSVILTRYLIGEWRLL